MSRCRWMGPVLLGIALVGCEEPAQIVETPLPGLAPQRPAPASDGEPQAIGEQPRGRTPAPAELPKVDIPPALPTAPGEIKTTKSGVKYETLKEGTGPEAKAGQDVTVNYTGTLEDGRKFDSSADHGGPSTFKIGVHQVITGWDEAVPGMKVGERRRMTIPSIAGYGASGQPPKIPPNATLIFDIELLGVK
jgi:hypothetical protein